MIKTLHSALLVVWALAAPAFCVIQPFASGQGKDIPFRSFEDDQGGFYVVWIDSAADREFILRAQHIDPQGHSLWEAASSVQKGVGIVVSSSVTSAEDWSGLADGQGGLILFWDERDGIRSQRFRADGTRRREGNSVLMSTSTFIQPDAVPDASGGTLVVWREIVRPGRSVIMAQRLNPDGKPLWTKGGIRVSLRASHQTNPRVIYDNLSGMIVAWRDEVNNASELRVQRVDFHGNRLWTLEGLKITSPLGITEYPIITNSGTGRVVISWTGSYHQTNQIFLQSVGPEAVLKWAPETRASKAPPVQNSWNPTVFGGVDGGTWVSWEDFRNQASYQVLLNHLDGQGSSLWAGGEIPVSPGEGDQGKVTMIGDGQEGVWLAWIDNRLATVSLYIQEVDRTGRLIQGPRGRLIFDQLVKPARPELVDLGPGKAAVVWADRPKKGQWTLSWAIVGAP